MTDPAPDAATVLVPYDRPCVRCSYSLIGLPVDGVCPECGYPIGESLRGNLLRHASPEYLSSLHRGLNCIESALVTQILLVVLPVVGATSIFGPARTVVTIALLPILSLGVEGVLLWGWWLFTTPDPGHPGDTQGDRARRITRVAAVLGAILAAVSIAIDSLGFGTALGGVQYRPGTSLLMLAVKWVVIVGKFFASMVYLRWLAPRIPSRSIERNANTFMWAGPLVFALGAPLCFTGPLVYFVWYLVLIDKVRQAVATIRVARGLIVEPAPERLPLDES